MPRAISSEDLGGAWLESTRAILADGEPATYDGSAIRELRHLDVVVARPRHTDPVIERLGDPERLAWMHDNFSARGTVAELGGADSYATRLYDYAGTGLDQVAWVVERLRADRSSRSATVTTFEPGRDATYIPCVSLLDFWIPDAALELVVTAHSIDMGTKGYANLVELARIQCGVAEQLGAPTGPLLVRVKSAHVYERDVAALETVLGAPSAPRGPGATSPGR